MVTQKKAVIPWKILSVHRFPAEMLCQQKNPHFHTTEIVNENVDNVDNLLLEEMFSDLVHISGAHGYQQIIVHAVPG